MRGGTWEEGDGHSGPADINTFSVVLGEVVAELTGFEAVALLLAQVEG